MCGIVGISISAEQHIDRESLVQQMCQLIAHRGPDDEGIYHDQWTTMGSRRLSIIDVSGGHQPICNENKTVWIVFNGEIYNYPHLAAQLRQKGHTLQTESDTEVIVHLYEDYGEACVSYLNGMFAFALWDTQKQILLLGRDRLGIKPLFYSLSATHLSFGSEIKPLLLDPNLSAPTLNYEALSEFLLMNYVPTPQTMLANVYSLPPGHLAIYRQGTLTISNYWELRFETQHETDLEYYKERLRAELKRVVQMQMISDVPLGAFLSGGVDSSAIVAIMTEFSLKPIKTFNVFFEDVSYSENTYARLVANHLQTDHYEILCRPVDLVDSFTELVYHADTPLADISLLPFYLVSRLAREQVKVVLSGDGADELFAGYPTYQADRWAVRYKHLPAFIRKGIVGLADRMPVSPDKMSFKSNLGRFVAGAKLPVETAHASWRTIFYPNEIEQLLREEVKQWLPLNNSFRAYLDSYKETVGWDDLSRHQYADLKVWLTGSILAKADFMSMAHSLEVRVPYLDHQLVEFAASIPPLFRLRGNTEKYVLRESVKDLLPKTIVQRQKSGFQVPVGTWFKNELWGVVNDILTPETTRQIGLFNWSYIQQLLCEHKSGRADHGLKLLGLITFYQWYNLFITKKARHSQSM